MANRSLLAPLLLVAFIGLPITARGAVNTVNAAKDNTIFQSNSLNSAGGWVGITAGTNTQGSPRRGLIAFDIAANVPAGSIITAAQLTLYLGDVSSSTSQIVGLHKLAKDWGEGTANNSSPSFSGTGQGATASPGDATWSHAMLGTVAWSNPGATGDFDAVPTASTSVGGPVDVSFTWTSSAMIGDLQSWLDAPATNFGWALINEGEATSRSQKTFYSREATQNSSGVANSLDPSWRPSLAITYLETGDYSRNGVVDAADYVAWRKTLNQPVIPLGNGADGDQSGTVGDGDYTFWRVHFGNGPSAFASGTAVPEPATTLLLLMAAPLVISRRRG